MNRRKLLRSLGWGALAAQWPLFAPSAHAQDDYKALVCVALLGGNDGNNLVVPIDSDGYATYKSVRGDSSSSSGAIGLPLSQLLPLEPASGATQYGLHPDLGALLPMWTAGQLALLFNVGTLVAPMSKDQYLKQQVDAPLSLYSHIDQQHQWQTAQADVDARTGWGGRMADLLLSGNGSTAVPPALALSNSDLFGIGQHSNALRLPESGGFGLNGFGGSAQGAVDGGRIAIAQASRRNVIASAAQQMMDSALSASTALSPLLNGSSAVDALFSPLGTSIGRQLWQVAKVIASRSTLGGVRRQVFFVGLGGFDTHVSQLSQQSSLFRQLGPALKAFHDAMAQLGVGSQVTSFTVSDFGRTLRPSTDAGSDHAWGSHHLILGGAVRGAQGYGRFPQLVLGGPDDVTNEGRWLPTSSVDQYGATLARWFGLSDAQLAGVFPNLAHFPTTNLGFMS